MMRSEFIERTGFDPTADEYAEIEAEYSASDLDKDTWCKKWVKAGNIAKYANQRRYAFEDLCRKFKESERVLQLMTSSRDYNLNLVNEYREETYKLKDTIMDLEHDRDEYRNTLMTIRNALKLLENV